MAAVLVLGLLSAGTASAQRTSQQQLQVPNSDLFGISVALSSDGSVALVGAPNTDPPQGAAYVFVRSGGAWVLQQKLQVPHPSSQGLLRFGSSVSLSADGRTALIGAQGSNPAIGGEDTAYVFARGFVGGYTLQQQLVDPNGGISGDGFGTSVSLSSDGRTALVGAPNPPSGSGGVGGGSAYVFARGFGWTLQQRLRIDGADFNAFGTSVSLSSDSRSALIGAPSADGTGATYVFARGLAGGFTRQQELRAADRDSGDAFGGSVSLSGDGRTALIGASEKEVGPNAFEGAAYVFARGTAGGFSQRQELQAADGAAGDDFGAAVSLDRGGSRALIGARGKDGEQGAAYVFAGGFAQRQRLQAATRVSGDFFGWSVALSPDGSVALIGAPQIHDGTVRSGAAYVFPALN
jgi:hypothetical protein